MFKKHEVKFVAHKKVIEPVKVKFETKEGKRVSFDAHEKVKEPVVVDFMAKDKEK